MVNLNMSDFSRQQKLASAKKKLRKYQKEKSPDALSPDDKLGKEILRGIQNNHIFKTPPLTVSNNKQILPNGVNTVKKIPNKKLNFSNSDQSVNPVTSYFAPKRNSSPVPPVVPPSVAESSQVVKETPATTVTTSKVKPTLDFSDSNSNSSESENAKKLDRSSEDLEQSLLSYKRANEQLGNQVNEQRKLILQLQEQLSKDGLSSAQLTEQRALKEQLEVHIQTIGILVSEKSELQSANNNIQKKIVTKESELEEYSNQLKNLQQQCVDFQKNIAQLQTSEGQLRQMSKEVIQERDRFSTKLYEVNHAKDELTLENSELHSKLQVKVEECSEFLNQVNSLQARLQQGELMVQQLSADGIDITDLTKWNEEKEELVKKVDEQNEMIRKLVHDKAELLEKQNDTQGHYDLQIENLKNMVNSLESEKLTLLEKSNSLTEKVDNLQNQLAKMKVAETPEVDRDMKFNIELENTTREKEMIEKELDIQINENRRLSRLVVEQNTKIEELENNVRTLTEDSLDKSSLLEQIQADKETISRALTQNKSLKEQLEVLEDGFVKVTNNSADLTDKLANEQNGNKDVATKLSTVQVELEENKIELNEKTQYCQDLETQLEKYKNESGELKIKMDSKETDMELLLTELETVKSELNNTTENLKLAQDTSKLVEKLQEELNSAQNAVNQLSYQNMDLSEKLEKLESLKIMNNNLEGNLYPERENFAGGPSDIPNEVDEEGKRSFEGLDNESVSDVSDIMGDQEAMMITRAKIEEMERNYHQLQEERDRMLELLEEERNKSINVVESIESHVQLQVSQCLKQKERELNEHFYEQTEALQNKCKSLQDALEIMRKNEDIGDFDMVSNGISMQSLKTAFMQLQKRYKKAMDQKALLSDRIEHLEHTNVQLENETETIGEYITLYQNQRTALKKKFEEKDTIIHRISAEHSRMQIKVTQLHHLVMQMLSERSGIESKNKQLQELVNRRLALQNGATEGSEVPKYDLDNLFGEMTLTPDDETELIKDNITVHDEVVSDPSIGGDETTQQILQIFEQLETSGEGTQPGWLSPAARKHDFLPCKNCMGPMLSL